MKETALRTKAPAIVPGFRCMLAHPRCQSQVGAFFEEVRDRWFPNNAVSRNKRMAVRISVRWDDARNALEYALRATAQLAEKVRASQPKRTKLARGKAKSRRKGTR